MHSYYICAYSKPYTVDQYSVWVCIHSLAYLCIHTAWAHVYMTCNRCDSMHVYITVAKDAVDSSYNQIWCLMSLLEKPPAFHFPPLPTGSGTAGGETRTDSISYV